MDDDEALYNQWQNFSSSGQWERARDVLGQILAREPDSVWVHERMGSVCYQLSDYERSIYHYREAIRLEPDNDAPYRGIAHTHLAMGRAGPADDHARKALSLNPDEFDNWTLMAHLCLHYEDKREAESCILRAASFAPESPEVLSLQAQLNQLKRPDDDEDAKAALADYQAILTKDPENESALFHTGLIHLGQTKDYQEAERCFRAALAQDPTDPDYQQCLIHARRKRDHVLRLLWWPIDSWDSRIKRKGFWLLALLALLLLKQWAIIIPFAFFLAFFVVFWPPLKLYEFLSLAEAHKQLGTLYVYRSHLARFHRLDYRVRFSCLSALTLVYWTTLGLLWHFKGNQNPLITWTWLFMLVYFVSLVLLGLFRNWQTRSDG